MVCLASNKDVGPSMTTTFMEEQLLNQMQNQISEVNDNINKRIDFFEYTLGIFGAILGIIGGVGYLRILSWIKSQIESRASEKMSEISDIIGDVIVGIGEFGQGSNLSAYRSLKTAYDKGFKSEMILSYLAYLAISIDLSKAKYYFDQIFKQKYGVKDIDIINYSTYLMLLNDNFDVAIKETLSTLKRICPQVEHAEQVKAQIFKMRVASGDVPESEICHQITFLEKTNNYLLLVELLFVLIVVNRNKICSNDCYEKLQELTSEHGGSRYFRYEPFVRRSVLDKNKLKLAISMLSK